MKLSAISMLGLNLDELGQQLRELTLKFSGDPVVASAVVLAAFVLGCFLISYFANR